MGGAGGGEHGNGREWRRVGGMGVVGGMANGERDGRKGEGGRDEGSWRREEMRNGGGGGGSMGIGGNGEGVVGEMGVVGGMGNGERD